MNTSTVNTSTVITSTVPQRIAVEATRELQLTIPPPRTSLPDRIAMRLGLWLIIWSTRAPQEALDRAEHDRRRRSTEARDQRARAAARLALLTPRGT